VACNTKPCSQSADSHGFAIQDLSFGSYSSPDVASTAAACTGMGAGTAVLVSIICFMAGMASAVTAHRVMSMNRNGGLMNKNEHRPLSQSEPLSPLTSISMENTNIGTRRRSITNQ